MAAPLPVRDTRVDLPAGALALGAYCLALGVVFYVPFSLSPLAQQNDVFMTNLFLGLGLLLLGSPLLVVGISQIAALQLPLVIGLSALNLVAVFACVSWLLSTSRYGSVWPVMAAYTIILLALSAIGASQRGLLAAWLRPLFVALAGVGLVTLYYALFGGQYYDVHGLATYLPRYLDGQTAGLTLLLGIAIFVLARMWARRA